MPLFCTSDARISHLRLGRTISTTLSSPVPHNGGALTRVNQRDGDNPKDDDSYQTTTASLNAKLAAHHNTHPSSDVVTHPLQEWMLPNDDPQRSLPTAPTTPEEQRVVPTPTEHRVTTPSSLRRITNAPPIMAAHNLTNKRVLKTMPQSHVRLTRNNIPGSVPAITRENSRRPNPINPPPAAPSRRSPCIQKVKFSAIPGGLRSRNLISQEAINFFTDCVWSKSPAVFTPDKLKPKHAPSCLDLEQVAMPMIHPKTGETISSYKKLMHNPGPEELEALLPVNWIKTRPTDSSRSPLHRCQRCKTSRKNARGALLTA